MTSAHNIGDRVTIKTSGRTGYIRGIFGYDNQAYYDVVLYKEDLEKIPGANGVPINFRWWHELDLPKKIKTLRNGMEILIKAK